MGPTPFKTCTPFAAPSTWWKQTWFHFIRLSIAFAPKIIDLYTMHIPLAYVSAFVKKDRCQHVLIILINYSKRPLDKRIQVRLLLIDLSKTFQCLTRRLLFLYWKYVDGIWSHASSLLFPYSSSCFISSFFFLYWKYVDGIWSHASSLLFPYSSSGFYFRIQAVALSQHHHVIGSKWQKASQNGQCQVECC